MDISPYISNLLKNNPDLALPDFGVIYKRKKRARINQKTGKFEPPRTVLEFKKYPNNDQVLINYVCGAKNLPRVSAEYFVNQYIEAIVHNLDVNGSYEIPWVGIFRKQGGEMTFDSLYQHVYDHEYYGLPEFDIYTPQPELIRPPEPFNVSEAKIEPIQQEEQLLEEPIIESITESRIPKPIPTPAPIPNIQRSTQVRTDPIVGTKPPILMKPRRRSRDLVYILLLLPFALGGGLYFIQVLRPDVYSMLTNSTQRLFTRTNEDLRQSKMKSRLSPVDSTAYLATMTTNVATTTSPSPMDIARAQEFNKYVSDFTDRLQTSEIYKRSRARYTDEYEEGDSDGQSQQQNVEGKVSKSTNNFTPRTENYFINQDRSPKELVNNQGEEEQGSSTVRDMRNPLNNGQTLPINSPEMMMAGRPIEKAARSRNNFLLNSSSLRYDIICKTFNNKKEAEDSANDISKQIEGVSVVTDKTRKLYRVCLGSYANRDAAERELKNLPNEISNRAWIMEVRTKEKK